MPVDDATELATRTHSWLRSLEPKKFAAVEKKLAKAQPLGSLVLGLAAVVGPRIAHTQQIRKQGKSLNVVRPTPQQATAGTGTGAAARPSSGTGVGIGVDPTSRGSAADARTGHDAAGSRSVRREDWKDVFAPDDEGPV